MSEGTKIRYENSLVIQLFPSGELEITDLIYSEYVVLDPVQVKYLREFLKEYGQQ